MARYGVNMAFYQLQFFEIHQTYTGTKVTSETITFDPIKILTCSIPQNDCKNLSFVKDKLTYGEKGPKKVTQRSFINSLSFPIGL